MDALHGTQLKPVKNREVSEISSSSEKVYWLWKHDKRSSGEWKHSDTACTSIVSFDITWNSKWVPVDSVDYLRPACESKLRLCWTRMERLEGLHTEWHQVRLKSALDQHFSVWLRWNMVQVTGSITVPGPEITGLCISPDQRHQMGIVGVAVGMPEIFVRTDFFS